MILLSKVYKRILTLSTLILLKAAWRTLKLCINSCSSLAWNLTFFRRIQPGNNMSMNWQYAAPAIHKDTTINFSYLEQLGIIYSTVFDWHFSLTWTQLLNLGVGEMQGIVDPCQHVMSAEVVNRHRCGVHIHCHPLPATDDEERKSRYSIQQFSIYLSICRIDLHKLGERSGGNETEEVTTKL